MHTAAIFDRSPLSQRSRRASALLLLAAALPCGAALAQDTSVYDRIWSHATLYDNPDNRYVQRFALSGRIQPEAAWLDAEQGNYADEFLWRRFRFGFKSNVLQRWVVHVEGDFDLEQPLGDMYERLTDAYVGWSPGSDLEVRVLKQSVGFTLDGATSSKKLLTMQRNDLTNNLWFTREYFAGVGARGEVSSWRYHVGVFSSEDTAELSRFDSTFFTLLSLGYRLAQTPALDSGQVRIDYVYNEEDVGSGTPDFSQVLSLVGKFRAGAWNLWTDLAAGEGYAGQSDVWGLVAMPFYDLDRYKQVVVRYTFVTSAGDNGVRLPRYEGLIVDGRGNAYNEVYLGFNYFFYGHRFKWQTGLTYASMRDDADDGGGYRGWGLNTGLRFYW